MPFRLASSAQPQNGFTLIELVIVIILVGILAVGASSLLTSRDKFSVYTAQQQFVNAALLAQQSALASQDSVELTVSETADTWTLSIHRIESPSSSQLLLQQTLDRAGASLAISPVPAGNVFVFDRLGNLPAAYRLTLSGANTAYVCLSTSGFAFVHGSSTCP